MKHSVTSEGLQGPRYDLEAAVLSKGALATASIVTRRLFPLELRDVHDRRVDARRVNLLTIF